MSTEKHIFSDQAGYLPHMVKTASVNIEADSFEVLNDSGAICFSGKTVYKGKDSASDDEVWTADLSALTEEGRYRIRLPNGEQSCVFSIGRNVYSEAFDAASKAFYYLRCGCVLDKKHAGVFSHGRCHTGSALVWDDHSISVQATGGWHDAGDYGRYVTAGACALAHLLYAYKLYPQAFANQHLNIPESGGREPDILAECRVELDWLMKMQRSDGAVYHKLTTKGHAAFIMPEQDTEQLYLLPPSSMAAADAAAVLALASGIYSQYDESYSQRLLECSLLSYRWLENNPDYLFENRPECTTGGYGERGDRDNRFWAAAELFALTGDEKYHADLVQLETESIRGVSLGYAQVDGLGMAAYILCGKGSEELRRKYIGLFSARAAEYAQRSDECSYGCSLKEHEYGWGSNMRVMTNAMTMLLADRFSGTHRYEHQAAAQLHYLLGRNPLCYSYISGIGEHSINYPHLRPAHADGIEKCIPGMVSGGPNKYLGDPDAKRLIPEGTPAMKCFADDYRCYSLNEITIYWNSPAVFVLAYFNSDPLTDA